MRRTRKSVSTVGSIEGRRKLYLTTISNLLMTSWVLCVVIGGWDFARRFDYVSGG